MVTRHVTSHINVIMHFKTLDAWIRCLVTLRFSGKKLFDRILTCDSLPKHNKNNPFLKRITVLFRTMRNEKYHEGKKEICHHWPKNVVLCFSWGVGNILYLANPFVKIRHWILTYIIHKYWLKAAINERCRESAEIRTFGGNILLHLSYSPDLALSDYHLIK